MSIHQEITINADPRSVYEVLTNANKFSQMTGGRSAEISPEAGGAVSLFGGAISARNVELVPDTRVVQAWRSNDWPEGVYSVVRFELAASGDKTRLTFDQAGHPDAAAEMLQGGWHQMYWEPMNAMLAG
jgi:activator of HSP90 ATPase